jgi:hypothetical protein
MVQKLLYIWPMSPFSVRITFPWDCVRFRELLECLLNFRKWGARSCIFQRAHTDGLCLG